MFFQWHTELLKWIRQHATGFAPSKSSWEKNNLADSELCLLWHGVVKLTTGVDNALQHYNIWLLAWGTGARLGSMVVAQGYGRSDILSTSKTRDVDETLRWKDVEFIKNVSSISVKVQAC